MPDLPEYEIRAYRNGDGVPAEAEDLFAPQLAHSRWLEDERWGFALLFAVTPDGNVLGGVHLDIGPIGGAGPLAEARLAYLERTLVRPEYRRHGLATRLMTEAIRVAREAGCEYIRCSNNWDNDAERALLRKCGFALVDVDGERDEEPCYLAVRPLQNLEE
jgi:GNAT superfamily N-acetyltransferase